MKARHIVLIGAALAALAGCSGPATDQTAAPEPSESLDAGTFDATAAYLTGLGAMDRALVQDARTALDRGMVTCVDIEERRPVVDLRKSIATRYAVNAVQAEKILTLTKETLCLP